MSKIIFNNVEETTSNPVINKYLVKSRQTELYELSYIVEATSESEARQKVLNEDCNDVETIDDNYLETLDREIVEIKLFNYEN